MALPALLQLETDQFLDPNIDSYHLYRSALKVFVVSFVGYGGIKNASKRYQSNLKVYQKLMMNVFKVSIDEQQNRQIIEDIEEEMVSSIVNIKIGIVKAIGINHLTQPEVVINTGVHQHTMSIKLARYRETQDIIAPQIFSITLGQLSELRVTNRFIAINLVSAQTQTRKRFKIAYREIHAEGYRDWFEFGNGSQLLIKVEMLCDDKTGDHSQTHLQFILHVLSNRVEQFDSSHHNISSMIVTHLNKKTETLQKKIDFTTQNAYWSYPPNYNPLTASDQKYISLYSEQQKKQSFMDYLKSHQIINTTAKYHDLHIISGNFCHETVEEFCVCSEWCNWSAFFFYNPITRFLLVQHHQLCLIKLNSLSMADCYLFICCYVLSATSNRVPIFRLLKSAKLYSEQQYLKSLTDNNFKIQLQNSQPAYYRLQGMSYRLLTGAAGKLNQTIILTEKTFFNEISIESAKNYYEVLCYVHNRVADVATFVVQNELKKWYKIFANNSRKSFYNFLKYYFDKLLNSVNAYLCEDILFNVDYSMFSTIERENGIKEVILWRNKVRQLNDNPYNAKLSCDQILALIISANNFIQRINPTLPLPHTLDNFKLGQAFTGYVDTLLEQVFSFPFLDMKFISAKLIKERPEQRLPIDDIYYYKYFTLKCYDTGHCVQNYFINSITNLNRKFYKFNKSQYACRDFDFIYRNDWIEASVKRIDFGSVLFSDESKPLKAVFNNFYQNVWNEGIPHRSAGMAIETVMESVSNSYIKLYLWSKINGNNRQVFVAILNTLNSILDRVYRKSELIYTQDIITVMKNDKTGYEYKTEVIDILVYWLVKANCFMFVSIAARFLKLIHSLHDDALVEHHISFIFSKPGIVVLFRTLHQSFIHYIHRIKSCYVAFDDEFERITNTLNDTRHTVKNLYRDVYSKLSWSWGHELMNLIQSPMQFQNHLSVMNYMYCTQFTICNGVAFIVAFVNDFRQTSRKVRKYIESIRELLASQPNPSIYDTSVIACLDISKLWTQDRDEISAPLRAQRWTQHFQQYLFEHIDNNYYHFTRQFNIDPYAL